MTTNIASITISNVIDEDGETRIVNVSTDELVSMFTLDHIIALDAEHYFDAACYYLVKMLGMGIEDAKLDVVYPAV